MPSAQSEPAAKPQAAIVGPTGDDWQEYDVFLAPCVARSDKEAACDAVRATCPDCRGAGHGSLRQAHSWTVLYLRDPLEETLAFHLSTGLVVYRRVEYDMSRPPHILSSKTAELPFDARRFAEAAGKTPAASASDIFLELAGGASPAAEPLVDYFLELTAEGRRRMR